MHNSVPQSFYDLDELIALDVYHLRIDLSIFGRLSNIRRLRLNEVSPESVRHISETCTKVEEIISEDWPLEGNDCLENCRSLTSLSIRPDRLVCLPKSLNLKVLELYWIAEYAFMLDAEGYAVDVFKEALCSFKSLEKLTLIACFLDDYSFLSALKELKHLSIEYLPPIDLSSIPDLPKLVNLELLQHHYTMIRGNHINMNESNTCV